MRCGVRGRCHRVGLRGAHGSVALELVLGVVALVLPIVWILTSLAVLQRSAYAVDHAAREAARAFATAADSSAALASAHEVSREILSAAGRSYDPASLQVTCHDGCLQPGSAVSITLRQSIALPWVPTRFDPDGVTVVSTVTVPVDRYRAEPGGGG